MIALDRDVPSTGRAIWEMTSWKEKFLGLLGLSLQYGGLTGLLPDGGDWTIVGGMMVLAAAIYLSLRMVLAVVHVTDSSEECLLELGVSQSILKDAREIQEKAADGGSSG